MYSITITGEANDVPAKFSLTITSETLMAGCLVASSLNPDELAAAYDSIAQQEHPTSYELETIEVDDFGDV